ncbi:YoaK family protein [Ornithinimicrobium cavernae]|uniref:YoaK family protein n=1 Tax=Ornithinimicrobium cavernae TaxID=2666047 RepID=UPI000D695255|nr:YoaK family protein [Ornithinimicrobium cavernae]
MGKARIHLVLMLALTFSTGIVDAVGFLGYDRVFTGNMTGNVVILGMGLSGTSGLPVLRPLLAFAGFMLGALLAGRVLVSSAKGVWTNRTSLMLGAVTLGCLGLVGLVLVEDPTQHHSVGTVTTTVLAVVMGMQAAAARKIGVADVTTVVVTSTIVGLASESRLAGGDGHLWGRRLLAIVGILAGALVGALTLAVNLWLGVLLTAVIIGAVTVIGHRTRHVA